jgi:hypothetical protein
MPGRHHEGQLVAVDHDRGQQRQVGAERDDAEVGAVVEDLPGYAAGERPLHRDVHVGIQAAVLVQQRQQVQAGELVGRQRETARAELPDIVERRERLLAEIQQPLGVHREHPPGVGEHAAPAGAVEQRPADLVLEPLDGLADRRLGPIERLGGGREAALPYHGDEGFELSEFHL